MKYSTEALKKYCNYLIFEYEKIKVNDGGRVMSDLQQFSKEGKIKDLIYKRTRVDIKVSVLNIYKEKITLFAKSKGIILNLETL